MWYVTLTSCFCAPRHEADRVDLHVRREGVPHLAAARQRDQRRGLLGGRPGQVWHLSFHDPKQGFHRPFVHTPVVWFLEIPVIWIKKILKLYVPCNVQSSLEKHTEDTVGIFLSLIIL
jgi:hypothetical protein